jgi:hypothetical protein
MQTYYGYSEGNVYLIYNGNPYIVIQDEYSYAYYNNDIAVIYNRFGSSDGLMTSYFKHNTAIQTGVFNYIIPYIFIYELERIGDFNKIMGE